MKRALLLLFLFVGCIGSHHAYADPIVKSGERRRPKPGIVKPVLRPGTLFQLKKNHSVSIFYSRKYKKVAKDIFETKYDVFDGSKSIRAQITARNDRKKRLVTVSVRDFQIQGYPIANTEVHGYGQAFPGPFGHIGKVGAANKLNPGQMMVRFATKAADYVQVISIADAHEDSGKDLQVYILEKR